MRLTVALIAVAILLGMQVVAIPLGVLATLYSQDLPIGDLLFIGSIALIVAIVPFAARVVNIRQNGPQRNP